MKATKYISNKTNINNIQCKLVNQINRTPNIQYKKSKNKINFINVI